jgi:hypothetical protein
MLGIDGVVAEVEIADFHGPAMLWSQHIPENYLIALFI